MGMQTHSFPHAVIHELLTPDLLHQVIMGVFKDHLVAWVGEYLEHIHGPTHSLKVIHEIDQWYVVLH